MTVTRFSSQSSVEYGMLMATIVVIVLIGANSFGDTLRVWLEAVIVNVVSH